MYWRALAKEAAEAINGKKKKKKKTAIRNQENCLLGKLSRSADISPADTNIRGKKNSENVFLAL